MSSSPQEPHQPNNTSQPDENEDESTLSPELAKLERILSRKQAVNLEGIKMTLKNYWRMKSLLKGNRTPSLN